MVTQGTHRRGIAGWAWTVLLVGGMVVPAGASAAPPSVSVIVADFAEIYGRRPTHDEQEYWKSRREDKPARSSIRGAMFYQKKQGKTIGDPRIVTSKDLAAAVPRAFARVYGRAPNAGEKRWWADRALCGELTAYQDLLSSMTFHHAKKAAKGTGTKEEICARVRARKASGATGVSGALGISGHARGPVVRIGIWKTTGGVQVASGGAFFVRLPGGKKKNFSAGDVVRVDETEGRYLVRGPGGYRATLSDPVRFSPVGGAVLELRNYADRGASGRNYNRFRGNVIVRRSSARDGVWAINELRTEDYLRGLAETTDRAPEHFQKALALAARTYVLHHQTRGGRQPGNGFDITNTANDQIYRGVNYEEVVPGFVSNVQRTAGHVVSHAGKLIAAVYFSGSDGRTRSAKEKWNTSKFPYLQGKDDPYGGSRLRGHGVGLSGDGAVGFARSAGWDYRKILTYYYTGVKIERGY